MYAKQYWALTSREKPLLLYKIIGCIWHIGIRGVIITTEFSSFVYNAIHGARIGSYWVEKKRFSEGSF